jgi:hypothetical protein
MWLAEPSEGGRMVYMVPPDELESKEEGLLS